MAGAVVFTAAPATAHALRVASTPDAGADVTTTPTVVTVTFGEQPDPRLSTLRVLDSSGHNDAKGKTMAVAGHPLTLEVAVTLPGKGVYTVAWTTVSKVDGHLASGTFAFGVGASPAGAASSRVTSPGPSDTSTAARWMFYVGVMVLAGGAVTSLVCFRRAPAHFSAIALGAAVAALAGALLLALNPAAAAHVGLASLLSSTFGHQLERRVVPLLVGAALLLVPALRRRPYAALVVIAIAGLASMWGDVLSSHAAASTHDRLLRMGDQWVHFASAGVWLGGLLVLLVGLTALAGEERSRVSHRFSRLALGSVVVLSLSGLQRALDEVGSWHGLHSSTFGHYIVVKTVLLVVLVGLGAVNRYRSVPAVAGALRRLRAVGAGELAVGAVVLVATALIQGLAPPASVAATSPKPVVVNATDFATTVKARLSVLPGTTGFNSFDLRVVNYDTGTPITASVTLTFQLPAQPDLGASTLALARATDGTYRGRGANLSIDGTWTVSALIQTATDSVTTTFTLTTRQPPEHITVARNRGLPDVYTIALSGGRSLQIYIDPGHPGFNEVHATYIGTDGNELSMQSLAVTASPPAPQPVEALTVRRLDAIGHYVADLPGAIAGRYLFRLSATAKDGTTFDSTITVPVH